MENQNEDAQDQVQGQDAPESQVESDSQNDDNSGDNTKPEQKNKSNWKKMSETNKALKAELDETRKENGELKEWANSLYDEEKDKPFTKQEAKEEKQSTETLDDVVTFYQKNPDALDFKDKVLETMKEYGCDRTKAWKFVQLDIPEESRTKKDFDVKGNAPVTKKALKDVNPEEALKLSKEDKREWRKLHGYG